MGEVSRANMLTFIQYLLSSWKVLTHSKVSTLLTMLMLGRLHY